MDKLSFLADVKKMLGGDDETFLQGLKDDFECGEKTFKSKIIKIVKNQVTVETGDKYDLTDVYNGYTNHSRHLEIVGDDNGEEKTKNS